MKNLTAVAVFCGARPGTDQAHMKLAHHVGASLAQRGLTVIYGGGRSGLMGAVADGALEAGGHVVGVIPSHLHEREVTHHGVSDLHVVHTMHERKTIMAERADAFIALPGGAGTLEEITEQWTWAQLRLHAKPNAFLDNDGYWDPMRAMLEQMLKHGYVSHSDPALPFFEDDLERALTEIERRHAEARTVDRIDLA